MQLIVVNPGYDDPDERSRDFEAEIREILSGVSEDIAIQDENIGWGADWPVFLLSFVGVGGAVFFSGKKLEENLDAWIRLSRRFVEALRKFRGAGFFAYRVDLDGAALLALERILRDERQPSSIELVSRQAIPAAVMSWKQEGSLARAADSVYVVAVRLDGERTYICGLKSTGEFIFDYKLVSTPEGFTMPPDESERGGNPREA